MKYAVAIDIGGTNTRVALIDEKYKIEERAQFSTDADNPDITLFKISPLSLFITVPLVITSDTAPNKVSVITELTLLPFNKGDISWDTEELNEPIKSSLLLLPSNRPSIDVVIGINSSKLVPNELSNPDIEEESEAVFTLFWCYQQPLTST